MNMAHRRIIAAFCAALLMGSAIPTTALSDTSTELQAQLQQAQTVLDGLYTSAEAASNELNKTVDDLIAVEADIENTSAQIDEKQSELKVAQKTLEQTVAANYKDGPVSLLSIVLASSSFDDFVSRIYYANKVSESYSQQIQTVRDIQNDLAEKRASLEEQRSSLEQLRNEQEEQKTQLAAKAAEVESYVAGLSTELQEALAVEAAARAEAARAEAAAALEAAGGSETTGASDADDASNKQSEPKQESKDTSQNETQRKEQEERQQQEQQEQSQDERQQDEQQEEPSDSGSNNDADQAPSPTEDSSKQGSRKAVVDYVLAQVGKPYVWASHGPDSFDCSGLTGAAYESIGIFVGYSDSYQVQFCNKPASEAVYGDIVWRPGHVGLCIGGGVTVEAFNPSRGVGYGSVDTFQLAGSPLP